MKTPITYYGGKQQLVPTILPMIPTHRVYVEPYFGGGAVFFAKKPSYLEVINDINENLMTFYYVVKHNLLFNELYEKVQETLHSEALYNRARRIYFRTDPMSDSQVDIAWATWVLTNISYNATPAGRWKWDNGSGGSHIGIVMQHYRENFTRKLHERLQNVQISQRDALDVIRQRDTSETFFYLDPPYPGCNQKHYKGFSDKNLEELLGLLEGIKGKFLLSNYARDCLMEKAKEHGWNVYLKDMPLSSVNIYGKRMRKTEVLVCNYKPPLQEAQLFPE